MQQDDVILGVVGVLPGEQEGVPKTTGDGKKLLRKQAKTAVHTQVPVCIVRRSNARS